jgi:hypothetical protein
MYLCLKANAMICLLTSLLLGSCAITSEQDALSVTSCPDLATAEREMKNLGELLIRLTRDQTQEAADAKYRIGLKSIERGWTTKREQEFIAKYLSSPWYVELQRQREPHRAAIAEVQSLWRQVNIRNKLANLCVVTRSATEAVTQMYQLNRREVALLDEMLERE